MSEAPCCSKGLVDETAERMLDIDNRNASRRDLVLGCRSVSKVNDEWFADEVRVRATVGLVEHVPQRRVSREVRSRILAFVGDDTSRVVSQKVVVDFTSYFCDILGFQSCFLLTTLAYVALWPQLLCGICFEIHPVEKMKAPSCGHFFCNSCWTGG
jgi:hypothetical protein